MSAGIIASHGSDAALYASGVTRGFWVPDSTTSGGTFAAMTSDFTPAASGTVTKFCFRAPGAATYTLYIDTVSQGTAVASATLELISWTLSHSVTASTAYAFQVSTGSNRTYAYYASGGTTTFDDGSTFGPWQESSAHAPPFGCRMTAGGWDSLGSGAGDITGSAVFSGVSAEDGPTPDNTSGSTYRCATFAVKSVSSSRPVLVESVEFDVPTADTYTMRVDGESIGAQVASGSQTLTFTPSSPFVLGTVAKMIDVRPTAARGIRFSAGGAYTGTYVSMTTVQQTSARAPCRINLRPS